MHLKIGGFQKNTFIDFPGVVASLVFTQGCNFRCPYCHNQNLIPFVLPSNSDKTSFSLIEEEEVFAFLKKRAGLIDGVAITGGEPTLQPALEPFCFRLKNMGFKIKVDTNGSRPAVIENLFRRELVDFIAMDIKSNSVGYEYIAGVADGVQVFNSNESAYSKFDFSLILESIRLIIDQAPDHEFRTTCVKPFITTEIIPQIGEMIRGASHYVLQHCSPNITMFNPAFFKEQDPFFSEDDLKKLKRLVEPYVQHCSIR